VQRGGKSHDADSQIDEWPQTPANLARKKELHDFTPRPPPLRESGSSDGAFHPTPLPTPLPFHHAASSVPPISATSFPTSFPAYSERAQLAASGACATAPASVAPSLLGNIVELQIPTPVRSALERRHLNGRSVANLSKIDESWEPKEIERS
jgi:hypothetical protein